MIPIAQFLSVSPHFVTQFIFLAHSLFVYVWFDLFLMLVCICVCVCMNVTGLSHQSPTHILHKVLPTIWKSNIFVVVSISYTFLSLSTATKTFYMYAFSMCVHRI